MPNLPLSHDDKTTTINKIQKQTSIMIIVKISDNKGKDAISTTITGNLHNYLIKLVRRACLPSIYRSRFLCKSCSVIGSAYPSSSDSPRGSYTSGLSQLSTTDQEKMSVWIKISHTLCWPLSRGNYQKLSLTSSYFVYHHEENFSFIF